MNKCYIIAEAGVNHNGNFDIAKRLVDEALLAGVDAVKFQIFIPSELVCNYAQKADYQIANDSSSTSQQEMLEKLSLSFEEFRQLKDYCDSKKIEFLATAFDLKSLQFLLSLKISKLKIPSGEITNYPYLKICANSKLPIILSTGMCDMVEVAECLQLLKDNGAEDITILHCTTEYPAPLEHINLNAMLSIHNQFDTKYGYSDHTDGILVSIMAATMGAEVIEKHFTLDKGMIGPDHKASLEPKELREMVLAIRQVDIAMGDGDKIISSCEIKNKNIARKSVVASRKILKGEILTEDNICAKRPGYGLSPMKWTEIVGTIAVKNFEKDEMIIL